MDPAETKVGSSGDVDKNRSRGKKNVSRGGDRSGKKAKDVSNAKDIAENLTKRQRRRERQQRRAMQRGIKKRRDNRWEPHYENKYGDGTGYDSSFRKFRDKRPDRFAYDRRYADERPPLNFMPPYNSKEANLPELDSITLNLQTPQAVPTQEKKPEVSSSSTSSSDESQDSIVKSLRNEVKQAENPVDERKSETRFENATEKSSDTVSKAHDAAESTRKPQAKVKMELNSKSGESVSDDSTSSSEEEASKNDNPPSVEDVICLGNLEKFEDLVEDEDISVSNACVLCDEMGHISFHCQMICKNCNGKYHGLKDCPKPANLSVVFSNFIEFCLKQSCKYNPNADFSVDISGERLATTAAFPVSGKEEQSKKGKSSKSSVPKANRKQQNTSSSCSSDSDAESTPTRKRKRRSKKIESLSSSMTMPFTVPYPPAYNSSFGFGPSGPINPLLAFSHMMGYNPPQIDFRGNMHGKEQL